MRRNEGGRFLCLTALVACWLIGVAPLAAKPPLVSTVEDCFARVGEERLVCMRKLGPATLSDFLALSDGSTNDLLIVGVLDGLRSLGTNAASAGETLGRLLPHRGKLYVERDKILVMRLRAYIVVTLSEIGFPSSALPVLFDMLAHVDERMTPIELGAAARAVRSLGPRGRAFVPYLLETLSMRISTEQFSLERYDADFPPREATTVQLEAIRSLSRVSLAEDRAVLSALRQVAGARSDEDPRAVEEAQRALNLILAQDTDGKSDRKKDNAKLD